MQFFTLIPNNTFILLCTVSWEWKALKTSDFYWKTIKIAKYDSNVSPIWTRIHPFVLIIFLVFFRGEKTAQHMWKSVWRHMKWQLIYCKKWNYFPVQNGVSPGWPDQKFKIQKLFLQNQKIVRILFWKIRNLFIDFSKSNREKNSVFSLFSILTCPFLCSDFFTRPLDLM